LRVDAALSAASHGDAVTRPNRFFLYAPAALLALAFAGYSGFWYWASRDVSARLDAMNGREVAPGVTLAFAEKRVGGFPFRFDVLLEGVTVSDRGADGRDEWAWRSERVAVHRQVYRSDLYVFEADGLQTISWPARIGKAQALYLTPAVSRASVLFSKGGLSRVDVDLWRVEAKDASPDAAADRSFRAERLQAHLLKTPEGETALALDVQNAVIGEGYRPDLGPDLGLLRVTGRVPPAEGEERAGAGLMSPRQALSNWAERRAGLTVEALTLDWSGVHVEARAPGQLEFRVGPAQLPVGAVPVNITGLRAYVQAVTRNVPDWAKAESMRAYESLHIDEPVPGRLAVGPNGLTVLPNLIPQLVPPH
jgi:hypothetical protein